MTKKEFTSSLAEKTGQPEKDVNLLLKALAIALEDSLCEGNKVMIPSLGTFSSIVEDEKILHDNTTNKDILYPPCVIMDFEPAQTLNSRIRK